MADIFKKADKVLGNRLNKQKAETFKSDRDTLFKAVSKDIASFIVPAVKEAMKGGKPVINVAAPKVTVPTPSVTVQPTKVNVPQPKVTVNVPKQAPFPKIPNLSWPSGEMTVKGTMKLADYGLENPLPVQLRDAEGKPVSLDAGMQSVSGGGGSARQVKITNTSDNPVPITGSITAAAAATTYVIPGNRDGDIYNGDNPLPVVFGASATQAVNVVDSTGEAYTGSNPVPVTPTDVSALATSANQLADGHNVTIDNGAGAAAVNIQDGGNTITVDGFPAIQTVDCDGTDVNVTGSALPTGAATSAKQLADDHNVTVSSITATSAATIIDSTGIGYSGDNPMPVRTTSLRGSMKTAYVTEDEVGEVTVLAGAAGKFRDLVYIMGANESDVAINLDIRQTTGGTVQMSIEIPAEGTAGVAPTFPIPQDHADATWTVQNSAADNSNTNYSVTALFREE